MKKIIDRLKGKKEKESAERQNCSWSFIISLKCVYKKSLQKQNFFVHTGEIVLRI